MKKLAVIGASVLALCACRQAFEPLDRGDFTEKQWAEVQASGAAMLFWTAEEKRERFSRMEDFFNGDEIEPSPEPRALIEGQPIDAVSADAAMAKADMVGLIVLKDGTVRYEGYRHGFSPNKRWTSFSTAKMFVGVLTGAAVKDGLLSIDRPVTSFVPELRDVEAYDGVTVEHLLTMSSGINWDEDYSNPQNDNLLLYTRAGATGLAKDGNDPTIEFLRTRVRETKPGTSYDYKSGDTALLGIVVERATGMPLAKYAKEKIVDPAGFEAPMYWMRDVAGHNIGPCCLSLRMKDFARFGLWLSEGLPDGKGGSVWTDEYRRNALSVQMPFDADGRGYGYQTFLSPRSFYHPGLFGQGIAITPEENVIIVHLAAWPTPASRDEYYPPFTKWWTAMLDEDV